MGRQSKSQTMKYLKTHKCRIYLLFQSLFLICSGLFWLFIFPVVFKEILDSKLIIKEGTPAYDAWKKPSLPTTLRVFLFSVENPTEVERGEKPKLEQVGPFVYNEQLERINEVFHSNGTVSYDTKKLWFFLEEESASLESPVTTVDVPILAAAEFVRGNWFQEFGMKGMMTARGSLFTTKTARSLLFDGYSDPLLTFGSMFAADNGIPMDRFGWFYKRNGTSWSDGRVTMATGENSLDELGDILDFNGSNRTLYPDHCGELTGTAAGFLGPDPEREFIDYYSTDICRPIRFQREGDILINGVDSIKFNLRPKHTFGNAETNPENVCYHANMPYGLHNSTGCKGGDTTLKTFVSLPHFLGADQFYQDQFEPGSVSPDPEQHSSSISLQKGTSIPTEVLMRLQIIIQLKPNKNIGSFFSNLPDVFLPVFWFDAEASVTADIASQLNLIGM